ncbi:serine hydrolase domain-containing protein [Acinetobacter piscicola]|uniref:serine hydrolase domain-containing protein n=1 Tax=Acinetobacter piscicola TaxID=2006115 RepID=UPI000B7E8450|nr:serine hydrolase domain-containing protein [Acinetobacter piscicola]
MKITSIILILLLVIVLSSIIYFKYKIDHIADRKNLEASIDVEVEKAMRGGQFQSIVVGVYKNKRTFIKGYGTVAKESQLSPDATTIFQIGSISKLFTASLLQTLCDQGAVSMDDTLEELIGDQIPLSSNAKNVTLKQLVTHTSGFPSIPKSLERKVQQQVDKENLLLDPYSHLHSKDIFGYLATTEDKRKSGQFEYSNYGMGLLGHVLELVTGKDYESLVKEMVLTPIGMDATVIPPTYQTQEKLAQGYTSQGNITPVWTFPVLAGAGGFYSNADDMLKFIQANLEEKGASSKVFEEMRKTQASGNTGIGWMQPTFLDRFFGNRNIVWHNGMVGGYATYLSIDAETNTGVIVLTNQANSVDMLGMMLTHQVRTQSWSPDTYPK